MSEPATLFACATAPGRAGVAVMRISGPAAGDALDSLAGMPRPTARRAVVRTLRDSAGTPLDRALVLWMPGPGSFTGEDTAELHLHGSRAVIEGVSAALAALPGLRPAEAGAFTRRAFDTGRLDLAEVEGLADLIAAQTALQRRQALAQMDGALSGRVAAWRERLLHARARLEAALDFSDEDLPPGLRDSAAAEAEALTREIGTLLDQGDRGARVREGVQVAIVGAPNAGKSSLLNALAQRDAAIVAETAGTTRDVVEVELDLDGCPVTLADTAGLRAASDAVDPVEREGMRRARARADSADLCLAVFDLSAPGRPDAATRAFLGTDTLAVGSKRDLLATPPPAKLDGQSLYAIAKPTGDGLDRLLAALTAAAVARLGGGEPAAVTRLRHREALAEARTALDRAAGAALPELLAEDLRLADRALGRIVGTVDVEDLLDVIFDEFCIGK